MKITEENARKAFDFLRDENAQALLSTFHYAMVYFERALASDHPRVRQQGGDNVYPTVRAYIQLINMLLGDEP